MSRYPPRHQVPAARSAYRAPLASHDSSFDASMEAELAMAPLRHRTAAASAGGRGREMAMEDSIDIDDSYPPPHRRQMSAGGGARTSHSSAYRSTRADTATPSPEQSDVDVSLSADFDYDGGHARRPSAGASAYPTSLAGAARSAAMAGGSRGGYGGPSSRDMQPRRSYVDDSSLEDLNPDNEPEPYQRQSSYKPVSAQELLAQRAAQMAAQRQQEQAAARSAASRAPARRPVADSYDDDEMDIDIEEDSAVDVRASNNTLIRKAQQMQEAAEASLSELDVEEESVDDPRPPPRSGAGATTTTTSSSTSRPGAAAALADRLLREAEEKKRKAAAEAQAAKDAVAAAAAKQRAEEAERERARERERAEEEEDRREREEAERQREALRKAAEVGEEDDEEDYADEFSAPEPAPAAAAAAARKPAPTGLDALDSADDDEAEIERARKQLEEEEEAELERERRAAELQRMGSTGSDPQLATAAFLNPNFARARSPAGDSLTNLDDLADSADLDVARQRQEQMEEEEEEQRRRQQQAQQAARRASLAAAIEDSYDMDDDSQRSQHSRQQPTAGSGSGSAAASRATNTTAAASAPAAAPTAASAAAPSTASIAAPASAAPSIPPVLTAALASLSPDVSAMLMHAVQQQLNGAADATHGLNPYAAPNPYALPNPYAAFSPYAAPPSYSLSRTTPRPATFDPSQSRAAAAQAWERLLALRAGPSQVPAVPPSSAAPPSFHGSLASGPAPALPQPPAAPAHVQSWESMLQQAAAANLARSNGDSDRLFTRVAHAPPASAAYVPTPAPPSTAAAPALSSPSSSGPPYRSSASSYDPRDFSRDGSMGRYIGQVLHSGLAEERSRTQLRVDTERDALRRLLTMQPYGSATGGGPSPAAALPPTDPRADALGASPQLSRQVAEQKAAYLQDQAILNSVLRRVLNQGQQASSAAQLSVQNALEFTPGASQGKATVGQGVQDDGRKLPANDVIRMIEEGYPHAAYDSWFHQSSNTLARSVMLAAEPPSTLFTRNVVEHTLKETLSELLSDNKVVELVKKATLKKLKHRLTFEQPLQHLAEQQRTQQRAAVAAQLQQAGFGMRART